MTTYLHHELDHLHELLELGDLVDLKVCLMNVEPALAYVPQLSPDGSSQGRDP